MVVAMLFIAETTSEPMRNRFGTQIRYGKRVDAYDVDDMLRYAYYAREAKRGLFDGDHSDVPSKSGRMWFVDK